MPTTRALLLALALEATPTGPGRLVRFLRRKTAFVATLLLDPSSYTVKGFLPADDGMDVLWQTTAAPRLAIPSSDNRRMTDN
ncbi:MAG: hypothetical protein ABIK86_01730 [candidate division WOR-3 bacterium]